MADQLERVQRLIWEECRKRRRTLVGKQKKKLMIGDPPYPNATALSLLIGCDKATAWRLIWGRRRLIKGKRSRPLREFQMTYELRRGIADWLGFATLSELDDAINDAPTPPDHPRLRASRRASHLSG